MLRQPAHWIASIGVALGATLILYGLTVTEKGLLWQAAGLGCAALTLFATRAIPEIVTAFAIFLAALALGNIPTEAVFSGFTSGGFWLLVSGITLGAAITATGLAAHISERLIALSGPSYPRAVVLIASAGLALGILIPSTMPRIVVMIPIAIALAERLGNASDSKGAVGLVATATSATLLPTYTILTANLPTIVHVGAMDSLYGIHSSYSGYLVQHLPVNALRFALLVALMVGFTRDPVSNVTAEFERRPVRPEQRRLIILLVFAIILWATDFLHGIRPAWIALGAAAIVLWPRFGILKPTAMKEQIDLAPAIFFASIVTVVASARAVGLDQLLADYIIARLPLGDGGLTSFYSVYSFSLILSHFTTAPAAPAVLVPFADPLAQTTGLSVEAISMIQIIGISTPLIPYQAPPLIVAMSLSKVPVSVFFRICLWLGFAVTLVGLPVTFLWWRAIGLV